MTLLETLSSIGITDVSVLPEKTQRKLREYNKTLAHPFSRSKKTGEFTDTAKTKLDDLAEDIIVEAKVYLKKSNTPVIPEPTEEEKRLAEEQRLAAEAAEKQRLEAEAAKNKKGPLQDFFGW